MNSSILHFGPTLLALWALAHLTALVCQFGFPRDTLRTLSLVFMGAVTLILTTDALTRWGQFVVFYYPPVYALILSVMGFTWPALIWLGMLDSPSQLQRKIMWRLPLLGAFVGHISDVKIAAMVFFLGTALALGIALASKGRYRYITRILVFQVGVWLVYGWAFTQDYLILRQLCFAYWIVLTHRVVNAILVKNLVTDLTTKPMTGEFV